MIKVQTTIVNNFYINPKINVIGIQMSGGADSTLVAYLLAKTIKEHNLNTKLRRITFGFGNKPDFFNTANKIQEKITELVKQDVWLTAYEKFYQHKSMHSTVKQLIYLTENKLIDHTINGRTKNPPLSEITDFDNSRVVERDNPLSINDNFITEPFYNITKDQILQEYFNLNIEDLLYITISCDADVDNISVVPCKKCWWCRERKWAFNKIGKHDGYSS